MRNIIISVSIKSDYKVMTDDRVYKYILNKHKGS